VHNLERPDCHVMMTGVQARGTLGRARVDGEPQVHIHGQLIRPVAKVHTVGGLSAHGDQADLLRWYGLFANHPSECLMHYERQAAQALVQKIEVQGAKVHSPRPGARRGLASITLSS